MTFEVLETASTKVTIKVFLSDVSMSRQSMSDILHAIAKTRQVIGKQMVVNVMIGFA